VGEALVGGMATALLRWQSSIEKEGVNEGGSKQHGGRDACSVVSRAAGWREQAVEEYERSLPGSRADLRAALAARLLILTGCRISLDEVHTDTDGRLAATSVEGMTFRLYSGRLVLARSCAHCGTGRFESPEIGDLVDFGYVLSSWRRLHEDCEAYDAEDLTHC
jgi:hypothetical protein